MQKYICKCGKTFMKSSKADSTGYVLDNYSSEHECFGCPFIVVYRDWKTQEITKRECRATPKITYRTRCYIRTADGDHSSCHLYTLDMDFAKRVLDYIRTLDGAVNTQEYRTDQDPYSIPSEWRAADFGNCYKFNDCFGLAEFTLCFQKNKKGIEARRSVKEKFFTEDGCRRDISEEEEKEIILSFIRTSMKEQIDSYNKSTAVKEEKKMKFNIGNMISTPAVHSEGISAVKELPVDMLVPYHDHPFILYSGERFEDMIVSVKKNGVLNPIIVRSMPDGKYEILAGHNRTEAAKQAGLTTVPAIVKDNISDEEAEMYVIETNLMQRGFKDLLISEQAYVVTLRHSKMFDNKKLSAIREELTAIEAGIEEAKPNSKLALVGEEYGLSKTTIARLIRVHKLLSSCNKFKAAVDTNRLSVRAAVELSYISSANALNVIFKKYGVNVLIENMWFDVVKIDVGLAEQLRNLFEDFKGSKPEAEAIIMTMQKIGDKPKKPKQFKVSADVYGKYFKEDDTEDHVNEVISEALEMYFSAVNN